MKEKHKSICDERFAEAHESAVERAGRILKYLGLTAVLCCAGMLQVMPAYADEADKPVIHVAFPETDAEAAAGGRGSTGTPAGYNYAYMEKLSEFTGWNLEYVSYEGEGREQVFDEAVNDLKTGNVDIIGPVLMEDSCREEFDFPESSYGTVYMTLSALGTGSLREKNVYPHEQLKVGVVTGEDESNAKVGKYLDDEGIDYELCFYDNDAKLQQALKDGEVDLISGVSFMPVNGTRVVSYFAPRPYYFAVSKGNTELAEQLDAAINKLNDVQPDFHSQLFEEYFGSVSTEFILSDSQKEQLKSIGTLHVLCVDNDGPYVFRNNGKATGMLVSIINSFAAQGGMETEYTFCENRSEAESKLKEADYDMVIGTPFSSKYCAGIGFITSERIMKSNFLLAYNPDNNKREIVAMVAGTEDEVDTSAYKEVKTYDNASLCLKAVKKGETDIAIGDRSILEYYTHDGHGSLNVTLLTGETQDICIALSEKCDTQLLRLFNDYIYSLTDVEKTNFLDDGSVHSERMTFSGFVQAYPVYATIIVSLLSIGIALVLFGGCFFYTMRKKNEELRLANEVKSDFLTRMSHDIRTPMNGIIGLLDISDRFVDNPELIRKYHHKIRMASEYLLALINDVLNMSKLESGKVQLTRESVYLREIVTNCRDMLVARADELGVTFDSSGIEDFTPPRVLASPLHLRQVIINIIGNAIKYNKPNGRVYISANVLSSTAQTITCELIIADTGIGMSEEFQRHAFEAFSQENRDAHGELKGTGLGLSIVKKLVDTMGGSIRIESKLGVGSKFIWLQTFDLDKDYKEPVKEEDTEQSIDLHGKKALAAEDNALNAEILQFMLEDVGIETVMASNGREALDAFSASRPGDFDFILMDIMMPEMNGYEAARAIRKLPRDDARSIPIIALTANAYAEDKQKALDAGMNDHVTKPIDLKQLLKVMAKCCTKRWLLSWGSKAL